MAQTFLVIQGDFGTIKGAHLSSHDEDSIVFFEGDEAPPIASSVTARDADLPDVEPDACRDIDSIAPHGKATTRRRLPINAGPQCPNADHAE
ncbi:hypothetical protein KIN20_017993 [Parelaphostrongylus tenuis]|uniref:Uncharacterized protein n=1 Tax=Parelaphostrongylus tenuis TaxID=148309 RepID=A0AAD5MJA0_PARTN|nr:hypothetical protein KIN20_017993 [Parelaphostrongylus tenuis]